MKLVYFYLFALLMVSCSSESESGTKSTTSQAKPKNPLDLILGEKIIDEKTNEIRPDNFQELYSITEADLNQHSELYTVQSIGDDVKIVHQKKRYSEARNFFLILGLEDKQVSMFHSINDFIVMDVVEDSTSLFLLVGDEDNHNKYWKTNNEIRLLRFVEELGRASDYVAKSHKYPLRAVSLEKVKDRLIATVEVITGCGICTNTFELTFDMNGNCITAIETFKTNTHVELDQEFIDETFPNSGGIVWTRVHNLPDSPYFQ